mgnify:CR=1 FL=1
MYQFKGFTEKANKALNLAIESAEEMRHNYVGTEHILYGLVKEGSGVAATALNECGVTEDALREKLESINGTMSLVELTPDDFTPRTKRVLDVAFQCHGMRPSSFAFRSPARPGSLSALPFFSRAVVLLAR